MAKRKDEGSRLKVDNLNEAVAGIHVDVDANIICETVMNVEANDMSRLCGGSRLLKVTAGRIGDVNVMVICHDLEKAGECGYVAPGSMRTMVLGKTKEDSVAGSCVLVGRDGTAMRSLTGDQTSKVLGTAQLYQFVKSEPVTCFCLTGFEKGLDVE